MTDARILVLRGEGQHADPWHGLEATSRTLGEVLDAPVAGTSDPDLPGRLEDVDLLVVNASGDLALPEPESTDLVDAIHRRWTAGMAVLGIHSSTLAFRDDPRWRQILGGRWEPGVTFHPQIGSALVQRTDAQPQLLDADFLLYDERYTSLDLDDGVVLAEHTEDGIRHPLIWARPSSDGAGAVIYSALGHGEESYDSPEHRELLKRCAAWLRGSGAHS